MHQDQLDKNLRVPLANFFERVFKDSEGEYEGLVIGQTVYELASGIDGREILCFGSYEGDTLVGAIFLTRLRLMESVQVYMLAPVAVGTSHQGQGIGKALIQHGLEALKNRSVSVVVTYGDPAYYSKLGFQALSESIIQAPQQLSMPEGWLGLSLTDEPIQAISERPICVEAFNNPIYW